VAEANVAMASNTVIVDGSSRRRLRLRARVSQRIGGGYASPNEGGFEAPVPDVPVARYRMQLRVPGPKVA